MGIITKIKFVEQPIFKQIMNLVNSKESAVAKPPMGWNGWDKLGLDISEEEFKAQIHRRTDKTPLGTIKNVIISNMTITGAAGIFISGAKEKHIEGLTLENTRINIINGNEHPLNDNPPDPFFVFGHQNAPYSVFCRYVDGLNLRNIQFNWVKPENPKWGGALRCWHVGNLRVESFVGRQGVLSKLSSIGLKDHLLLIVGRLKIRELFLRLKKELIV